MASFMDITDKKIAAQKIEQLNLTLNTMLDIHHLIARQKKLGPLMQGICDRLVSRPGYYTAAIFLLGENGGGLKFYHSGDCYYDSIYNSCRNKDLPICVRLALDARNMVWLDNRKKYCRECSLLSNCGGGEKLISIRLKHASNIYGVLVVSLSKDIAFMQQEQSMLKDICNDISFAIDSIKQNNVSARLQKRLKISERELKRLNENMKCYVREITEAQEQERKRIACDLHDDTVQKLASIKLDLFNTVCEEALNEGAQDKVEQIVTRVAILLDDVNKICYRLRPGLLDQLGLAQAVELLAKEIFRREYGLTYNFEIVGKKKRLEPQIETNLYRISQEAMHNVVKHSKADTVNITLSFFRDKVRISIKDNGIGFKKPRRLEDLVRLSKLGLTGIRERTRLIKGDCQIRSSIGTGTSVTVEVPV
jgi:two-component system sensor histidine kinase DegS